MDKCKWMMDAQHNQWVIPPIAATNSGGENLPKKEFLSPGWPSGPPPGAIAIVAPPFLFEFFSRYCDPVVVTVFFLGGAVFCLSLSLFLGISHGEQPLIACLWSLSLSKGNQGQLAKRFGNGKKNNGLFFDSCMQYIKDGL